MRTRGPGMATPGPVPNRRDEDHSSTSGSSHGRREVVPHANDLAPSCRDEEPRGDGPRDLFRVPLPAVPQDSCASLASLISDDLMQALSAPATPPRSLCQISADQVLCVLVPGMLGAPTLAVTSPWLRRCGSVRGALISRCLRCTLRARRLLPRGGAAWVSPSTRAVRLEKRRFAQETVRYATA